MTSPSRRELLAFAGLAANAAWEAVAFARPLNMPIGLQPYGVRNELQHDTEGTVRKLAAMGYQAIEVGDPFYGMGPAEAARLFKSLGLASPSGHFAYPADMDAWDRTMEHARMLNCEYMITTVPNEWRKTLDGWKRGADKFNELGARCKKNGLTLAYHNHNFEYKVLDGVIAYDHFLQSTDPDLVKMQMDVFWTTFAGQDPLKYFGRYPGRFHLLHIKDLKKGYEPTTGNFKGNPFTEVGNGIIDWTRIFQAAPRAGMRHYFVEQDRSDSTPLESAKISCEYLKKLSV